MADIRHATLPIDQLKPHARNYRKHPEQQLNRIGVSLTRFGQVRSIVVQEGAPGSYVIVAGHGLAEAAKRNGFTELHCDIIPATWTPEQIEGYLIADNETSRLAEDDEVLLAQLLEEQQHAGYPLESLGSSDDELAALLESLGDDALGNSEAREVDDPGGGGDDFDAEPEDGPTRTQSGDIWQLGDHRLMCGDSSIAADVARLLDGAKINISVTSPPYASQRAYDPASGFKPITPDEYSGWFEAIQRNIAEYLATDGSFFLNIKEHVENKCRQLYVLELVVNHVRNWKWLFIDEYCWAHAGLPGAWPNRFKNGWEPVFHFARNEVIKFRPNAVSEEKDTAFRYDASLGYVSQARDPLGGRQNFQKGSQEVTGLVRPSNVLNISTGGGKTTGEHPAEYPVGLPSFFIQAFSDPGDIVYEPFGGSGTTMIAAERLDRCCRIMEISPRYCDIILRRWETETGQTATLLHRAETE